MPKSHSFDRNASRSPCSDRSPRHIPFRLLLNRIYRFVVVYFSFTFVLIFYMLADIRRFGCFFFCRLRFHTNGYCLVLLTLRDCILPHNNCKRIVIFFFIFWFGARFLSFRFGKVYSILPVDDGDTCETNNNTMDLTVSTPKWPFFRCADETICLYFMYVWWDGNDWATGPNNPNCGEHAQCNIAEHFGRKPMLGTLSKLATGYGFDIVVLNRAWYWAALDHKGLVIHARARERAQILWTDFDTQFIIILNFVLVLNVFYYLPPP